MHRTHITTRRSGFTLIEMLVVMSIIILLAGVTIQVAGTVFNNARRARTSALLTKIESKIKGRQENFARLNKKKFEPIAARTFNVTSPREIKLLAHKLAFKRYFPQTWQELQNTIRVMYPNLNTFNFEWQKIVDKVGRDPLVGVAQSGYLSPTSESSEVLLFVLTQDELLGVAAVDADEFSEQDIGDLDEDGIKEFVDGWSQPLRFYRWPTRLIRPGGVVNPTNLPRQGTQITEFEFNNARSLISSMPKNEKMLTDLDDTIGAARGLFIVNTQNNNLDSIFAGDAYLFEGVLLTGIGNHPDFVLHLHTPFTYSTPLVVSAGGDGILGLLEPTDTANLGHLAAYPKLPNFNQAQVDEALDAMDDNMTNQNLRAGG